MIKQDLPYLTLIIFALSVIFRKHCSFVDLSIRVIYRKEIVVKLCLDIKCDLYYKNVLLGNTEKMFPLVEALR